MGDSTTNSSLPDSTDFGMLPSNPLMQPITIEVPKALGPAPETGEVSRYQLYPQKPFNVEEFCKDIPISVLRFGVRFNLTLLPEQKLPEFFNFLKDSFPNQSWANLAADKSYIDISFRDQHEAKAAADKEFHFQEHKLKPVTTLCYKNQLAFIIFKDFSNQSTLEEAKKRIFEKIATFGTPIKVAFLEIVNTSFLAPLAAAVVSVSGDKIPESPALSSSSSSQDISYTFKGLIEYCSSCNTLGHVYCSFNPPKNESPSHLAPPTNGHGAGDLKASSLSALNSRGTSIPLSKSGQESAQNSFMSSSSQLVTYKDIIQDTNVASGSSNSASSNGASKNTYSAKEYKSLQKRYDTLQASYYKLLAPGFSVGTETESGRPNVFPKSVAASVPNPSASNGPGKKRGRPRKDNSTDGLVELSPNSSTKPMQTSTPQAQPQIHKLNKEPQLLAPKNGPTSAPTFQGMSSFSTVNTTAPAPILTPTPSVAPASFISISQAASTPDTPRKRGRPRKVQSDTTPGGTPIPAPKRVPKANKTPTKTIASGAVNPIAPVPKTVDPVLGAQPVVTPIHSNAGALASQETIFSTTGAPVSQETIFSAAAAPASQEMIHNTEMIPSTTGASASHENMAQLPAHASQSPTLQSGTTNFFIPNSNPQTEIVSFSAPIPYSYTSPSASPMGSINQFSASETNAGFLASPFIFMPPSTMTSTSISQMNTSIPQMNAGFSMATGQSIESLPSTQGNNSSI